MREGSKNTDIRILNQGLILQQIAVNQGISRVDIANKTNLTKTTVSNVVQDLIRMGYVIEGTDIGIDNYTGAGRRPVQLAISDSAPLICGMLLKRNRTTVVLGTLHGKIVEEITEKFTGLMDPDHLVEFLLDSYRTLREKYHNRRLIGVGISCMGIVDSVKGEILNPARYFNVPTELPIIQILKKEIDLPIFLMHDTGASVVAEQTYATKPLPRNFAYVTFQSGIGAGLVLNGQVANGQRGHGGELGHMSINQSGVQCVCGNYGCLEMYANLENMVAHLKTYSKVMPNHPLMNRTDLTFEDFVNQAKEKDPLCITIIEEFTRHLSTAFVNLVNLLDITYFIIEYEGGTGSRIIEDFLETSVNKMILASNHRRVKIRQSKFGEQLPLVSAFAIVAARVFNGDLKI